MFIYRKHIATQSRHPSPSPHFTNNNHQSIRSSHSLSSEYRNRGEHRRSESLDTQFRNNQLNLGSHSPHQHHHHHYIRRSQNYSLTMDLNDINNFTVEGLNLITSSGNSTTHDYAEIYTPSVEKKPIDSWSKTLPSCCSSSPPTSTSATEFMSAKPPTPPLHRFPSWEAKIYEVANDGLASTGGGDESDQDLSSTNVDSLPRATGQYHHQTVVGRGYTDINIPVYATVKGRASQIRSIPFTDSSDDSSDAEENAAISLPSHTQFNNSHNSTCTDNTETSISGSSPSKSLKTSSSLSPAKHQSTGVESNSPHIKHNINNNCIINNKEVLFENETMDYALPPDAISNDALTMHVSTMMRASYIDSPNKKTTDAIEKTGHLVKLGGKLKTWRKRWFVLKNGTLTYWKSQHDVSKKPRGEISLDDACRIIHAEGASTFEIDTGKKIYYLTADSNALMDDWVKALISVQKRNAAKLLLSKEDQKSTVEGWLTKVKNGHSKRCWCILLGKMFLYFKTPHDVNPLGQINMRDTRVEEMLPTSDSDSEESDEQAQNTIAIHPNQGGPTYLIFTDKQDRDNWLYHLTIVSGGGLNSGTQFEQIVQKLMEADGDASNVLWRHPILLYSKDNITTPLTSLNSEELQNEALKLFKVTFCLRCCSS
jgi:pleckstrin homology domain-containing family H